MNRPVTLMTSQWGDMKFEELCRLAAEIGYDGLEINCGAHFDVAKAAGSKSYCEEVQRMLDDSGLKSWTLAAHVIGQCVGDQWDPRLDNFAPGRLAGKPEEIRKWAVETMLMVPHAAKHMGIDVVTGFMGSPIWAYWYSFPQTTDQMIDEGFAKIVELWNPILDEFDKCQVKFALEVHPTEIAFDYYTAERLLKEFANRKALGFNFDPSHLLWQGCDPVIFLRDFIDRVYHVHMKDIAVKSDGKGGVWARF